MAATNKCLARTNKSRTVGGSYKEAETAARRNFSGRPLRDQTAAGCVKSAEYARVENRSGMA